MARIFLRNIFLILLALASFLPLPVEAAFNADVVTFLPANDGGRFITVYESSTLQQLRFNLGLYFDYAFEPIEFADQTGQRRRGIIDDLVIANLGGAIGVTDWLQLGFNVPMAVWETFYNPNLTATAVRKQSLFGKLADPRIDFKLRLLDIERYRVGLAIVPFLYFPVGREEYFLGNGMWSGGGMLVFDADIQNVVSLGLNSYYRVYKRFRYDTNNVSAIINDTIGLSGAMNVRMTRSWSLIGEAWIESVAESLDELKNGTLVHLQNPAEFLIGTRFQPQKHARGLGFTIAAGRAMTAGIGSPDFRIVTGINYRKPAVAKLPEPVEVEAVVEEKIVITQKIHFEFNSSSVRPASYPILDDVATLLAANPQIQHIKVEGHTDNVGGDAYNQRLSDKRAKSVAEYLVTKGIASDRLYPVGYGESKPIADNTSSRGRARNRRTEFTVVDAF
ncbi:MAG: hypothetical protein A3I05_00615 [Deltaproteobacteria bacterium RIFCSPLOWO2_02_FULL_44_10]|nr:MAG: hypothetical protein A3C46_09705 [Deltaproteobacteria bacterium RIFCSPHIGHO2_02_FULL_44_16]OGQ45194.1 MAG: hypothetical protein A3I05_00615 [Deltaproteobacteria bacterium RIFCSPLOWO2_02_FULL_44_10]